MEKRKILFVMPHMGLGGAAKALVTLLNEIDYNKYDVDLQLYDGYGFNLDYLPARVNVIPPIEGSNEYCVPFVTFLKKHLCRGHFVAVIRRIYYAILAAVKDKNHSVITKYYNWQFFKKYIPMSKKKYDLAIGFLDGVAHYYTIDRARADKKICWVHNDYSKLPTCNMDINYLKKADVVFTISPKCVDEINKLFPGINNVKYVYNLNSPSYIKKMAEMKLDDDFADDRKFKILSVGRLCKQKAYHFAIQASHILKEKGYHFVWNIIGDGELYDELNSMICELGVQDEIRLLGTKENPYPYIALSDIVVQCSIYEGKSIALDEAKILQKPIVCTNYNSAKDQIEDGITGIIVPISAEGVANGVQSLIDSAELRQRLSGNLSKIDFSQDDLIDKYNDILSGNWDNV